jgi:two-component system heavy metal sensor histidine kinase CusS
LTATAASEPFLFTPGHSDSGTTDEAAHKHRPVRRNDSAETLIDQARQEISAIVREVADYHEAALAEGDVELTVSGDAAGAVDVSLIKRALSNLLGNAIRYATPGTPIEIRIEQQPDSIELSVTNQGEPVEPMHQERLFDRFFRADASRAMGEAHHGLGLSIVAGIARMHGGAPFVNSSLGGTTIGFSVLTRSQTLLPDRSEEAVLQAQA